MALMSYVDDECVDNRDNGNDTDEDDTHKNDRQTAQYVDPEYSVGLCRRERHWCCYTSSLLHLQQGIRVSYLRGINTGSSG